ncbi:MAG TPA: hypothetical protein VFG87_12300 [Amycolatopsis sp.]|jgi:hypothetical protein|nr:hypothetical protein [Amycolatopsis sp.]
MATRVRKTDTERKILDTATDPCQDRRAVAAAKAAARSLVQCHTQGS